MLYSLSNTLVNINRISTGTIVTPNNGYKSPAPNSSFYVAPISGSYYIQPTP